MNYHFSFLIIIKWESMIPNPYTEIASMITGGISALTDPDTYDTISEAVDETNKVLYGKGS